jgi:integrase
MAKGIYKRGKKYWIRYAGLDGKTLYETSGSERFRDAQDLYIQRKEEIKKGKQPEIKRIKNHSFNDLATEYEKWAVRQKSFDSKPYLINQLKEVFGNLPLRRFSTMLIEQYQTERLNKSNRPKKNGKTDTGNKPATVNRLIATLSHMFTKAVDWNMVEEGVLKRIRKVKMLPENNRRLRYLSKEECKELVNSSESHLKPILITALNTGMRKSEILNLKWNENVDLKHGFILLGLTKNGDRREIPINDTLRRTLQATSRRLDTPYVFYDMKTGKPYKDVKRSFKTAVRKAKIHDFKFHDTRHTFASHLIMAGLDITTVKELLGHKTLTMTLRYAHLAPSHKVKAVDLLDSKMNGKKPTIQKLYNQASGGVL